MLLLLEWFDDDDIGLCSSRGEVPIGERDDGTEEAAADEDDSEENGDVSRIFI